MPFLNGGLFEPHPLEREAGATSPTTCGATPSTVCSSGFTSRWWKASRGIAPDMLGRVFEGVMAAERTPRFGHVLHAGRPGAPAGAAREWPRMVAGRLDCIQAEAERRMDDGEAAARQRARRLRCSIRPSDRGRFCLVRWSALVGRSNARASRAGVRRRILRRNALRGGSERRGGPAHRAPAVAGRHRRRSRRAAGDRPSASESRLPDPPGRQLFDPVGIGYRPASDGSQAPSSRLRAAGW